MDIEARRTKKTAIYLVIFLISLYSLSISTFNTSRNQGEGFMRISDLEMLLWTGHFGWDGSEKWGSAGLDGKKYNWHGFGQQIVALPLYLFTRGTAYSYYAVNIASTALTCLLIMRMLLLLGFSRGASAYTGMIYGTATLAWYYAAKTPHEHALAIALTMTGVYYGMRYAMGLGRWSLIPAMAALGFGFFVRHDVVVAIPPIAAYVFLKRNEAVEKKFTALKAVLVAAAVFAPFFAAESYYNYVRFGDILETGYMRSTGAPEKMFGVEFLPRGLIGAFLSPGKSIFLFSPVIALFPFYIAAFKRRVGKDFFLLLVSFIAIYSVFYAFNHSWDGDWCFGPRYFLVIIPFMVMPMASVFEDWKGKRTYKKALIIAVIVLSVAVQTAFVSSNAYMSSVMRYGISDDGMPELSAQTARKDLGEHGSWQWLWSYFRPGYSQFFNQLKVFVYTVMITVDDSNVYTVVGWLKDSEYPFLLVYMHFMQNFDLWWLQETEIDPKAAVVAASAGVLALILFVRSVRPSQLNSIC